MPPDDFPLQECVCYYPELCFLLAVFTEVLYRDPTSVYSTLGKHVSFALVSKSSLTELKFTMEPNLDLCSGSLSAVILCLLHF